MRKVKRLGLEKLKKSILDQNYFYLLGLHEYSIHKPGGNYKAAIRDLLKSLTCSRQ